MKAHDSIEPPAEAAQTVLAKNVVIARVATGLTQHELAAAADDARATVAQIETGVSDPRLSTIEALAQSIGVPTAFLLLGRDELRALASLSESQRPDVPPTDVARMRHLLASGLLRDRVRAGRLAADAARRAGASRAAVVCAAVLAAIEPGDGTAIGMLLGDAAPPAATGNVHLNVHYSKNS